MEKIIFIISAWGDSHQLNRVHNLSKLGYETVTWAYTRDYYPSKIISPNLLLGRINHGKYWRRVTTYFRSIILQVRNLPRSQCAFYVFGFDNLIIILLLKVLYNRNITVVYEISDIRDFELKGGVFFKVITLVYYWAIRLISLLIVTSEEFVTEYLANRIPEANICYQVMENKVDSLEVRYSSFDGQFQKSKGIEERLVVIGYFGLIRCSRSLDILLELLNNTEAFSLVIRGKFIGIEDLQIKRLIDHKYVQYLGTYHSPDDLFHIYNDIDVSWICYPYSGLDIGNWRWARTNRYYEAGYFQVPMIAAIGTVDSRNAEKYGIGWSVDLRDKSEAVKALMSITMDSIESKRSNYHSVRKESFVISDDYECLNNKLKLLP